MNVEELIPYERDIYVGLIRDDQEKQKEARMLQQSRLQAQHSKGMF